MFNYMKYNSESVHQRMSIRNYSSQPSWQKSNPHDISGDFVGASVSTDSSIGGTAEPVVVSGSYIGDTVGTGASVGSSSSSFGAGDSIEAARFMQKVEASCLLL